MANLHANRPDEVDAFMAGLEHPLAAEVQALREIIKGVDERVTEQIKWKAPSFSRGDYIATFNLRARQHVHLIFHNPRIAEVRSDLLTGDHTDRRMAYFTGMEDVRARRAELERVVREVIRRNDEA